MMHSIRASTVILWLSLSGLSAFQTGPPSSHLRARMEGNTTRNISGTGAMLLVFASVLCSVCMRGAILRRPPAPPHGAADAACETLN